MNLALHWSLPLAAELTNASGAATGSGMWLLYGLGVLAFLSILVRNILGSWTDGKKLLGRKPPLVDDLARYSAALEQFKLDLAKLPDEQKFAKLAEQMAGYATLPQLAALEISFDRQIKDVSGNAHTQWHSIRNDFGSRLLILESGSIERGERLAAVEANIETLTRTVEAIDTKLDRQGERIADKVQGLLEKWRDNA